MRRFQIRRWEVLSLTEHENKRADSGKILKRILSYMLRRKGMMFLAVVMTFAANIFVLMIPHYSGKAIDAISEAGNVDFQAVTTLCLYMFGCVMGNSLLSYLSQIVLMRISSGITEEMRKEVFEHLLELPVSFFDNHQAGDLISRISYDIDTINTSLSSDLITVATSAVTVIGSAAMMIRINLTMCIVFVFTTPLII